MQKRMYGTWDSPITPSMIAAGARLNDAQWAGETLVWLEGRGAQGVLVAQTGAQAPRDLTDSSHSVRGRVGYGGGEFTTIGEEAIIFAGTGGRLYRLALAGGLPKAITPAFGSAAAPRASSDGRWVVYVHHSEGVDGLALVDAEGELFPRKLAYDTDFVMQPVWHPQGSHIAYVAWNFPQMPWDGAWLKLAHLTEGPDGVPSVANTETLAGSEQTSIFQPEFSPDGRTLAYVSDQTGWWQLYLYDLDSGTHTQLTDTEAEHGAPAWVQGTRTYAWSHDGKALYFLRNQDTRWSLWRCEISNHKLRRVTSLDPYSHLGQISASRLRGEVALIASAPTIPDRLITCEIERVTTAPAPEAEEDDTLRLMVDDSESEVWVRRRSRSEMLMARYAEAQPISWKGHDGDQVYGLYSPPTSPDFESSGAPPLIVKVHGGPTSQTDPRFSPEAQFYTSRGYAFLEVNHRGSTGYGKEYRDKLLGAWGTYDVEDSMTGAQYLVDKGLADALRLVILGGSAGGYTVLQSLVSKPGFWRAGVCLYGISNQFTLALNTDWKFEARYLDQMFGALPDAEALYRERSPLFHADNIKDAVIIFQGEDDPVVPKAQADSIVAALKRRGVPHEYHVFAGEGHGWRKPETIERYYALVLDFLKQYVIFG
ncbi:MAG: prolyl oligopeptidase family serine peptidase [Chloroflexi bacterium]|nr:prolyl oligopeptidase family serine peptidase [Chloroflexota bacterium]